MNSESVKQWFFRTQGEWFSRRRYIYANKTEPVIVESKFKVVVEDDPKRPSHFNVEISWDSTGDTESQGVMSCYCDGKKLYRDKGYMTEEETESVIQLLDFDTIMTYTVYNGMAFREEIRMATEDIRLRQTIGFKEGTPNMILCGQYLEERIK